VDLDVEAEEGALELAEGEVALPLVEVGQVIDELEAVGLLVEPGLGLELDGLVQVLDRLLVLLGLDEVGRVQVVAVPGVGGGMDGGSQEGREQDGEEGNPEAHGRV
jgi:hypothetical protein